MSRYKAGKYANLLRSSIARVRRKGKNPDLYGRAGTPSFEELWLTLKEDARRTLNGEEAQTDGERTLYLNFLVLP